ncbi:MAG: glycosyltransferase [Chloroflexota bacterium]|nr:glycosyltransferase [Chloroflexota bacterium]
MRFVLAGGGTAGHIFPTLAVARRLRELLGADTVDLTIVSGARELDRELYRGVEFDLFPIHVRGIVGVRLGELPARLWRLLISTVAVWRDLGNRPPDAIVLSGGYVSVPVMLAGWLRRIPRLIFSGDAQLGWATKALAPLATVATVAFPEAVSQLRGTRVELTGYPLRDAFAGPDRDAGRAAVGVGPGESLVLVVGGSQGAHAINAAIARDLTELLERAVIVHVTGPRDIEWIESARESLPGELRERYHVHAFIRYGFADLMAGADLIVTRSGATAVAELGAVGTPAVIAPGAFGAGHQIATANAVAETGAAVVLLEDALTRGTLGAAMLDLLADGSRLARMRQAAAARGRPQAADAVARLAIGLADPTWQAAPA